MINFIMKNKAKFAFEKFSKDTEGNVAIQFALALVPMMALVGAAIDYSRVGTWKNQFQAAADSAVLAAVRADTNNPAELKALANRIFAANLPASGYKISNQSLIEIANGYTYTAHASMETTILKLAQISELDFSVKASTAKAKGGGSEVALVFDITASMGFGSRWQSATQTLINTLGSLKKFSGKDEFYVTLLPMGDRMKLPLDKKHWLKNPPKHWNGCVELRPNPTGALKYRLTDAPVSSKKFQAQSDKHYPGYNDCPNIALTGPTNNLKKIERAVNNLRPRGTGRFDVGMAWAFSSLSPKWRGDWGKRDYPSPKGKRDKIAVLLTDGNTNAFVSTYPRHPLHQFGGHYGNRGTREHFENLVNVCKQMKKKKIKIHTVWVRGNTSIVPYLKKCATNEEYFHEVRGAKDLGVALSKIGGRVSNVRLTE